MKRIRKLVSLLIGSAILAGALGACNTMEGAGKDIERGGEKLQDTAKDTKHKM